MMESCLLKVCFYCVIKRHGFVPAVLHKCIVPGGFYRGTGCQISVRIPEPNFVLFLISFLQNWLLVELAEQMLAALLGRVTGLGLLKLLEAWVEGGHLCRYLTLLTTTRPLPRVRAVPGPCLCSNCQ